jgi:D-arabinose 1-dehydrogenase-like Zn-dependent alcohol dehydrogenase
MPDGTSSVGMAAIVYAKDKGLKVLATTRNEVKADALREQGADRASLSWSLASQSGSPLLVRKWALQACSTSRLVRQ